jgi:HlyD family secretion protein
MIRIFFIPLLAIAGMVLAAYTVVQGARPPVPRPPVIAPPQSPYAYFVAGAGIIEASSQNIAIGSPVGAVVTAVHAGVGDYVRAGDPLFQLEDTQERAHLVVQESEVDLANRRLERLLAGTRPEQIPPAEARLAEAQAFLDDTTAQLAKWEQINDPRAVSEDDISRRRFAVLTAQARVDQAAADLDLLRAGTWSEDISIARAEIARSAAMLERARADLTRRSVRAPIDGRLLQVNIRAGEFAQAGPLALPLILMGAVTPLHVRTDVDEHEAWRVKAGAPASAFIKGNKEITFPLRFVRFEPYVVPKRSLSGDSQERVDTRVLQIIYAFDPGDAPIYVGQQVDVYIEAPPLVPPAPQQSLSNTAASDTP